MVDLFTRLTSFSLIEVEHLYRLLAAGNFYSFVHADVNCILLIIFLILSTSIVSITDSIVKSHQLIYSSADNANRRFLGSEPTSGHFMSTNFHAEESAGCRNLP